jgi:hypothetical protein
MSSDGIASWLSVSAMKSALFPAASGQSKRTISPPEADCLRLADAMYWEPEAEDAQRRPGAAAQ